MAISKNGLTIFALLVSLVILETGNFIESPCLVSPDQDEEHFLPHTRHRRSVLTDQWDYVIDVVVNASNAETFEQLQSSLNATGFPIQLDNNTKISDINITTVCSSTNTGFQCRCGEEFAWPYSTCVTYGVCDYITSGICKCINAIPADGQFCQPVSVLLDQVEYEVEVELNVTDVGTVDYLRSLLNNGSFSLALGPTVNVTNIEITTVCYPNGTSFQCRCEDQYVWSYTNCVTYGACDNITDGTCSCINSIPANGQYCQPKTEVVPLYEYILEAQISVSDFAALEQLSDSLESISFPVRLNNTINITGIDIIFTVPPIIYEYQIFVEVNTTDADQLRNTLKNTTFPVQISTKINISATDITTVCSQNGTGFLCRCEDDYLWPCDKCDTYGKCDGDTDNTCSCIKAIPTDGQYCQSIQHQNLTVCPPTTTPPSTAPPVVYQYLISIELNISDVTVINGLRSILSNISYPISINNQIQISDVNISTVCSPSSGGYQCRCEDEYRWSCDQCLMYGPCDNITDDTCGCINALPPDGQYCQPADQYNFTACPLTTTTTKTPPSTTPPVVYQYLISIELNISDVTVLNGLRSILSNISYPISINNQIQISDVNISTVCSPSSGGYQCRCEDVYRWSCDQCLTYGPCDNITDDTCGCINALPPDGQYCQPADQYNFTACPLTTTPTTPPSTTPPVVYQYLISIELNISDVTVLNGLRSILSNISYPISINNQIQISDVNISTVCSPSSGGYQCRCEDVYRWSCDQCLTYGPCDNITDDTCGCINALPPDGQYCQPADQYNFTACPLTTTPTTPPSTTPPVVYQYLISIELNISDVTVLNGLRSILSNISYPISINNQIQISDVNISTVCSPSSGGYQCRCEDVYRWSCDQCLMYGPCDNITDDTCGCINALPPDGQYCQPADQYNFTACPLTTTPTTPPSTTPPVVYQYLISIELNISDVTVLNGLRSILSNISYPISINNQIQISDVNISTVCSPSSGGYQCRCEDVYRWSCDQCLMYGPCDNITDDTCGCINALPPDGQYCQPADQYNFTTCPVTTRSPSPTTPPVVYEYIISIELNTTDVTVINRLRNISFPISINNDIQVSDMNISTVCSPSSGGYQCRCEDVYRWSCDQCLMYGPCDNITDDTCGCINALPPDGQYCQPADQYNFTACPLTTTPTTPPSTTPPVVYQYLISIELNISDVTVLNGLRSILSNISYPISINNQIQISDVNISTVCSPSSGGYQCRCEDVYRWSCDQCLMYGPCDNITDDTCGCINALPPDGQYCQPADQYNFTTCPVTTPSPSPTTPPVVYEYIISIELNTTDVTVINRLRNISFPISINNDIQVSDMNISTVCSPSSGGYQCRCEDVYRWSCDQCLMYGPCDNITDDTCGCINALPPDGQYCQPVDQYNFTACPLTTTPTTPPSTTPPVVYQYLISIELNISDVTVINGLRSILSNISYPISINNQIQISDVNISTVCSPSSGGYQCRCEDVYRWSCDQCLMYGPCDNITDDTCGCINALPPDGQYCQPADQYNFTACPLTTTPTTPPSTTPPVVYQYLISIELNISDVTVINGLRSILSNISYPISINNQIQISDVNISTVCSPSSGGYQCRCEDVYRWSCDQCLMYGPCDNITDDTCGCINALPPDGQYCQPADQYNFTACPLTTTPTTPPSTTPPVVYQYLISIELNISDATVINGLRSILSNISYPISINNQIQISDVNISTVCSPSSGGYQCRCEDEYRWSCDQCLMYGPCDNITDDTCGCINALPPDGQYCQPVDQYNFTACPLTTTPTTPPSTRFSVEMSVRLDKEFTPGLNDESSSEYKTLKLQIETVLANQYKGIKGFISVIVTAFRPGSIITDFVVQTTQVDPNEIAEVNQNLPGAISSIAPVIGSVSASYNSPTPITIPDLTYTGNSMRLVCGPPVNIDVGQISRAVWTFKEREIKDGGRNVITTANDVSTLVINNVISADSGPYRCTLMGKVDFIQEGIVREDQIKQAPTVRLRSEVNVKCAVGKTQPLPCCVQSLYTVRWFLNGNPLISTPFKDGDANCIRHNYILQSCEGSQEERKLFICRVDNPPGYEMTTTMIIFKDTITCTDDQYGSGRTGDRSSIGCDKGQEGSKTAVCLETGEWKLEKDTCIVTQIKELLIDSQDLVVEEVPQFTMNLSQAVQKNQTEIAESSATISAIVNILNTIAGVSTTVSETTMQNVLDTVDVIIADDARESWTLLNANETRNSSSALLGSLETLSGELGGGEFAIATPRILLNRTTFNNSFRANLNSSIVIDIPETNISNVFITTITLPTLNNVMPVRNSTFNASLFNTTTNETVNDNTINAAVVLIKINETIQNVSLKYKKRNSSLGLNPQCVFWNFTLFDNLGAWDDEGCAFVSDINGSVTCSCNHLTSFSILMSTAIPPSLRVALDVITYVGVGISLASLVICLIIEGYVWKAITRNSTAFMRHVSIINTALSLLIADICFIIGASIANNPLENPGENYEVPLGPCSTATFFMHFFYLALFFWMLVSGLLLLYRTVMVFSHMSKSTMLAIGFSLGYGCPLIIAVITVAVTAPADGYIRRDYACWLNWTETKALLALVIPALTIVFINIIIVIVVLFKMLRRGVGDASQTDEKHTLVVITRCVIILTPLFGLTWALGVGTMISSTDEGVHIAFAFFNSLQGFFILVFGTLFDSKIRSILSKKSSTPSSGSNPTRSTSGGVSSSSGMNLLNRLRGRRYMYHISQAATSSSSGASESFVQI
ncbi:uncharacterized protein LOC121199336 isoform X4 [Toxotes jaculatrix]|uniref:uncharacterized protein LOC121199336 isoform X4 n=1 Tax=Toxotes jaculatrix TaxID=941984 RepID=UPI001B3A84C5|nr:uncharacterized protein LOC121199336 isoform X4 [Toxotes jaculatrix]